MSTVSHNAIAPYVRLVQLKRPPEASLMPSKTWPEKR